MAELGRLLTDAHPLMPFPGSVELERSLVSAFRDLWRMSEDDGIEYGCNLFLQAGRVVAGRTIKGEQSAVDLATDTNAAHANYVGDFHVHPYQRKMGPEAAIGFSTTDIESDVKDRRKRRPLLVHFVFAGTRLYMSLIPLWVQSDPSEPFAGKIDTGAGLDYIDKRGHYKAWEQGISARNTAGPLDTKIDIERKLWDSIPGYAKAFSKANKAMNKAFADFHRYGLYIGKDAHAIRPDATSYTLLKKAGPT